MKEIFLSILIVLVLSVAAAFILDSIDYSSTTTFTSENNSVRLSSDMKAK